MGQTLLQKTGISEDQSLLALEILKCKNDPWYFIITYCRTHDPRDQNNCKPFPNYPYLEKLVNLFYVYPRVLVCKSRQIRITWVTNAFLLWLFMFFPTQLLVIQCLDEDTADYHLKTKFHHMYLNLPGWMQDWRAARAKFTEVYCKKNNSRVMAVQQGEHAFRSLTASAILVDEMAEQDRAEESLTAALPTIHGGGRFIGVATPKGHNFFWEMWNDEGKGKWVTVMPGFRYKINTNNFVSVELLHYADPSMTPERLAEERKSYKHEWQWQQEMEGSFITPSGRAYFPEWAKNVHEATDLKPTEGQPLLCGWDFGFLYPAAVIAQYDPHTDQMHVLWECRGRDEDIYTFSKRVLWYRKAAYPAYEWMDFCDFAGSQRRGNSSTTEVQVLISNGLAPMYRYADKHRKFQILRYYLLQRPSGEPGMIVDINGCPIMTDGFRGAFHFIAKKKRGGSGNEESEDSYGSTNRSQDIMDALGYIYLNHPETRSVIDISPDERMEIPNRNDADAWARYHRERLSGQKAINHSLRMMRL